MLIQTDQASLVLYLADCHARALPDYTYSPVAAGRNAPPDHDWVLNVTTCRAAQDADWIIAHKSWSIVCPGKSFDEKDVEVILLFLLSHLYTTTGLHCVHAVGLCNPKGRGLLLVGNNGDGKTLTSLRLLSSGYSYVGNDRVVLMRRGHDILMTAGSRPIRVRLGTTKALLPDLSSTQQSNSAGSTGQFLYLNPQSYGFRAAPPTPVHFLFRIRVAPIADKDCSLTRLNEIDPRYSAARLYQMIAPYLLGRYLVHLGIQQPFPAIDTDELAVQRLQLAEHLMASAQSFEVFGNEAWVAAQIQDFCDGG